MVAAGEGCTLLPALAGAETVGVVCRPAPSEIYSSGLAWRRTDPRDAEFLAVANSLRATVASATSARGRSRSAACSLIRHVGELLLLALLGGSTCLN